MASLEYIQKRIAGKEKEIEKLQKKMERILKAEASNWEINPYYYDEMDLRRAKADVDAAQKALEGYKADLAKETEKAESRNVKPILEFLEGWKDRMRRFYRKSIPRYFDARQKYWDEDKRLIEAWQNASKENRKALRAEHSALGKNFHAEWGYMEQYIVANGFDWTRFEKDIKRDAEQKYDNIIERTNPICGVITDATGLSVGEKGDLDGYVIGERGTAHVHTIGAGGYNIQCYHFRVLVHEVK